MKCYREREAKVVVRLKYVYMESICDVICEETRSRIGD